MNRIWTQAEKEYIKANAGRLKDEQIAAAISRLSGRPVTLHSVRHVRRRMGTKKRQGRGICEVTSRNAPMNAVGMSIQGGA